MPVGDPQFWLATLVVAAIVGRGAFVVGRGVLRRRRGGGPGPMRVRLTVEGERRR